MKLNKSKSLYVMVLLVLMSVAFIDHKRNAKNELTYALGPQQTTKVLMASETHTINPKLRLDETNYDFTGIAIPCK